jgi:hypothetical protein
VIAIVATVMLIVAPAAVVSALVRGGCDRRRGRSGESSRR